MGTDMRWPNLRPKVLRACSLARILTVDTKRCRVQEGVASNHVFVFEHKASQQPYTHSAEVKSVLEKTTRNSSKCYVYLQKPRGAQRSATEKVVRCACSHVTGLMHAIPCLCCCDEHAWRQQPFTPANKARHAPALCILNPAARHRCSLLVCRCTIPYAKDTIPLFIVFRAMGFVADKEILQHIVYDFGDAEMMDLLRPSIEEAKHVTSEEVALDWIARRVAQPGLPKAKRVAYAHEVLQKELLPHIGIGEMCETRKAYFLGYMVHRMLLVALGRQPPTDRDSYAVKRLRMAGPLMADLFRCASRPRRAAACACHVSTVRRLHQSYCATCVVPLTSYTCMHAWPVRCWLRRIGDAQTTASTLVSFRASATAGYCSER